MGRRDDATDPAPSGSGSAASFDAYVADRQAGLVRYATLLCGSPQQAEDLVQEVLIRVYPRWTAITARDDPHAYVRRSVTNEFLSFRRRWSTRHIHVVPDAAFADLPATASDDPSRRTDADPALWAQLMRLPRQQRAAVVLRYYEDLTDDEIGQVLSCRPGTVRAHVSRGLATLRLALQERAATADDPEEHR